MAFLVSACNLKNPAFSFYLNFIMIAQKLPGGKEVNLQPSPDRLIILLKQKYFGVPAPAMSLITLSRLSSPGPRGHTGRESRRAG